MRTPDISPTSDGHPISKVWDRAQQIGLTAIELAQFQAEPVQMSSGTVGKNGFLRVSFERRGPRTIMTNVERRIPFLVQRALYWDEQMGSM